MDLQPNKTDGIYLPITNTRISASEWNQLVGSCMAFITEAGLTPDASDNKQFLNAFKAIAAGLELVGANTNLSNLTATGEARFTTKANTDLSNVTNTGKSTGAGWAMPSDSYKSLTLGASASSYTAPADGWFCLNGKDSGNTGTFEYVMRNQTRYFGITGSSLNTNRTASWSAGILPVKTGDVVQLYYSGTLAFNSTNFELRFYYAEGSKSEAN